MSIIKVSNLGKKYRLGEEHSNLLSERIGNKFSALFQKKYNQNLSKDFWALKDVSFEIQAGEVVGIIGKNGAGKSTLLKILSRITPPTTGEVEMLGRVASLLEVGTGFHPELTGRENIYLNGAILGMSRTEIKKKFDEIVAFAEVEKFIDTPVKRYSSGMYVRLAFAVAAYLESEILIVDEVLAVGDLGFQKKCLGKMGEVASGGRSVLFVSHNMVAVKHLCQSIILLENGQIKYHGKVDEAIRIYRSEVSKINMSSNLMINKKGWNKSSRILLRDIRIISDTEDGLPQTGKAMSIEIEIEALEKLIESAITIDFKDTNGILIFRTTSFFFSQINMGSLYGIKVFQFKTKKLPFTSGFYICDIRIHRPRIEVIVNLPDVVSFFVTEGDFYGSGIPLSQNDGFMLAEHEWVVR